MNDNLDRQVTGPVLEVAAKVAALMNEHAPAMDKQTDYGLFHVGKIEIGYSSGGRYYIAGYVVPDEGDGSTWDFWTAKHERVNIEDASASGVSS